MEGAAPQVIWLHDARCMMHHGDLARLHDAPGTSRCAAHEEGAAPQDASRQPRHPVGHATHGRPLTSPFVLTNSLSTCRVVAGIVCKTMRQAPAATTWLQGRQGSSGRQGSMQRADAPAPKQHHTACRTTPVMRQPRRNAAPPHAEAYTYGVQLAASRSKQQQHVQQNANTATATAASSRQK